MRIIDSVRVGFTLMFLICAGQWERISSKGGASDIRSAWRCCSFVIQGIRNRAKRVSFCWFTLISCQWAYCFEDSGNSLIYKNNIAVQLFNAVISFLLQESTFEKKEGVSVGILLLKLKLSNANSFFFFSRLKLNNSLIAITIMIYAVQIINQLLYKKNRSCLGHVSLFRSFYFSPNYFVFWVFLTVYVKMYFVRIGSIG